MTKPIKTETPEKIKKFLSKPGGRKFFRQITADYSNSNRQELKKSMTSPKAAARRRIAIQERLICEINK